MLPEGFVYVNREITDIQLEIRYATCHNITGKPLTGYTTPSGVLTSEACNALKNAFAAAAKLGYGMLIYDAYRPQSAVDDFLNWSNQPEDYTTKAEFYPDEDKTNLFQKGYIALKSGHSRGSTVDLTLTENGIPVDMGTCFDFMDEKSHHGGNVVKSAQENRKILQKIMLDNGFTDYDCEWWHYRLADEPYKDTYFNFEI